MPTTLVAVITLLALVLPGFIVAELANSRRASRGGRTDIELVLRALWYSLVLHLVAAATGWTVHVYHDLDSPHEWEQHVTAIALYGLVTVVVAPTIVGLSLGAYLRRREQAGRLKAIDYALGASDSRHAWDYVFQHVDAGYVVIHLKTLSGDVAPQIDGVGEWGALVGTVGRHSWASQTPASRHDLYLQEVRPATLDGRISASSHRSAVCGSPKTRSRRCSCSSPTSRDGFRDGRTGVECGWELRLVTRLPRRPQPHQRLQGTRYTDRMTNDPRVIREGGYQGTHDPPPPPASMYGPQIVPAQPAPAPSPAPATPAAPADAD